MSSNPLISLCLSLTLTLILLITANAATLTDQKDFDSADRGLCRVYVWSHYFSISEIDCNDVIQLDYFYPFLF